MQFRLLRCMLMLNLMVFVPTGALAQNDARDLTGCYVFEAHPLESDSTSLVSDPGMLPIIEFVPPADSGRLVLFDTPHSSKLSKWEARSADSVLVSIEYGFSGVVMQLEVVNGTLKGTASSWSDGMGPGRGVTVVSVAGRPIPCPRLPRPNKR
jgi:hypothetical protein